MPIKVYDYPERTIAARARQRALAGAIRLLFTLITALASLWLFSRLALEG